MNNDLYNHDWIEIDGNSIHKTAIIHPNVTLGKGNTIGAYCVIGSNGEMRDVSQKDFKGTVVIGNNNVISEFVSIQRPYKEHEKTFIGNNNIIMAHFHCGHSVIIGSNCELCTGVILGGYSIIEDNVRVKLKSVIRNRKKIGINSVVGMGSVVTKDIPPNEIWFGNPARKSN